MTAPLFNRTHINQFHHRSQKKFEQHNFLFTWALDQINDRLSDIKRSFSDKIILGDRIQNAKFRNTPLFAYQKEHDEIISLDPQSADCIISVLDLHAINNLPQYLFQIRHALRDDGLFIGALFGGETLHELCASLMHAEIETCGGASPRVYPFADKQQMGELMQRAGFALPVIDSEILHISYQTMFNLLGDVRGMGESNALMNRNKKFTSPNLFYHAAEHYQRHFMEADGRVTATFEIIFVIGWAPHESQQQPQKRGSAQVSLADHLK